MFLLLVSGRVHGDFSQMPGEEVQEVLKRFEKHFERYLTQRRNTEGFCLDIPVDESSNYCDRKCCNWGCNWSWHVFLFVTFLGC